MKKFLFVILLIFFCVCDKSTNIDTFTVDEYNASKYEEKIFNYYSVPDSSSLNVLFRLSANNFIRIFDTIESSDQFSTKITLNKSSYLKIKRNNIDGPYYDGPRGLTALTIRLFTKYGSFVYDLSTIILRGQYFISGYFIESREICLFETKQWGCCEFIHRFCILNALSQTISFYQPKGKYQYASISPNGKSVVLIDNNIHCLNISDGDTISYDANLPWFFSEPTFYPFYDLTDRYLDVKWFSDSDFLLRIKDSLNVVKDSTYIKL